MNRKYYLWDIFGDDRASKNAWIITELDLIEPSDPQVLVQGKRLRNWNKENRALYPKNYEGYRTDNVFAEKVFLHSYRLKRLIQSFTRDEVDYYPILIERKDERKRVKGYFAMIVLDPVDAIDWNLTPYEEVDGEKVAADEQNIILDRAKIGGRKILQLLGNNNAIIVRDDLVQAMRNSRMTGIGFTEVHVIGEAPVVPEPEPAWLPEGFDYRVKAPEETVDYSRGKAGSEDSFFEERVEDVLACLGETKPKTYAKKISDAKRLDGQALARVLIEAIRRGDWSRVALPMLVGGQVVDLFIAARISPDLWDHALETLEIAGANCRVVPGPGYLRIYQDMARCLMEMAVTQAGTEEFMQRVRNFRESRGWVWTRHWFGPKPGFENYRFMESFDNQLEAWQNGGTQAYTEAAPKAPIETKPAPVAARPAETMPVAKESPSSVAVMERRPLPRKASRSYEAPVQEEDDILPVSGPILSPVDLLQSLVSPLNVNKAAAPAPARKAAAKAAAAPAAPEPVAAPVAAPAPAPAAAAPKKSAPAAAAPVIISVPPSDAPRLPRPMIALSLRRRKEDDQRTSKFGGLPYLPAGEPWPRCGHCGESLRFLFQVLKSDLPIVSFPPKSDLLALYGCVNENCSNRTGETADSSLWQFHKMKQRGALIDAPPKGVDLLPNCAITFKEPEDDCYDPGHSASMTKRDKKKKFGDLGENYASVKFGGYPTYWHEPIEPACACGKPMIFLFQTTPDGQRSNLTSPFVNQSELFAGRLELWWHCPDWCKGEESLLRIMQKV